jgi:hypothetical protein
MKAGVLNSLLQLTPLFAHLIVNCRYVTASFGLVGMVPYQDISEASGFPDGFRYRGYDWAADLTAVSIGKRTSGSAIEEIQLESTHHTRPRFQ